MPYPPCPYPSAVAENDDTEILKRHPLKETETPSAACTFIHWQSLDADGTLPDLEADFGDDNDASSDEESSWSDSPSLLLSTPDYALLEIELGPIPSSHVMERSPSPLITPESAYLARVSEISFTSPALDDSKSIHVIAKTSNQIPTKRAHEQIIDTREDAEQGASPIALKKKYEDRKSVSLLSANISTPSNRIDKQFSPRHRATPSTALNSYKKLSKPFRSPLIKRITDFNQSKPTGSVPSRNLNPFSTITERSPLTMMSSKAISKSFKSPLIIKPATRSPNSTAGDKRATQLLEKKLLILKQAKKARIDGSTKSLQGLALKWKTAAREAAQDLWSLAQTGASNKDAEEAGKNIASNEAGGFVSSWGYDGNDDVLSFLTGDSFQQQRGGAFQSGWAWNESCIADDSAHAEGADTLPDNWEPPSPERLLAKTIRASNSGAARVFKSVLPDNYVSQLKNGGDISVDGSVAGDSCIDENKENGENRDNVGTMLVQLGIGKEILGWQDSEEDFVD